jgi:predicted membrane protein
MAMQGTSRTRRDRPATGVRQPGIARAMYVVLSLLAVSAFAQPVFALALASVGLLVAIVVQNLMGQTSLLAVHVPLGVAILGLTGTLLARTRNLTRPSTDPRG